MRSALCLILCLLLVGCGTQEVEEPVEVEEAPPLSDQMDSYELRDVVISSVGGYTGYVERDVNTVEIHPYFNLSECLTLRVIQTSDMGWWEHSTSGVTTEDMGTYQLVQRVDGSVYGFMPIDNEHGIFVTTQTLALGYVKLYMDNVWISGT